MAIIFDPGKNERNIEERGLSFELVEKLEWNSALIKEDIRRDYGEIRLQVFALLNDRLYAVVVTPRGEDLRVISFRKANQREVDFYGKKG